MNGVANLIGSVGLSVAGAVLVVLWLRSVQELVAMAMWYILHSYATLQCLFLTRTFFFKKKCRYFTGHTKNPDGTTQFLAGTTGVKQGFMGAIRILTIAVCIAR